MGIKKWEEEIIDSSKYNHHIDTFCGKLSKTVKEESKREAIFYQCKNFFLNRGEDGNWLKSFASKKVNFMKDYAIPLCEGDQNCLEGENKQFIEDYFIKELKRSIKILFKNKNIKISKFINQNIDELVDWNPKIAFQIVNQSDQITESRDVTLLIKKLLEDKRVKGKIVPFHRIGADWTLNLDVLKDDYEKWEKVEEIVNEYKIDPDDIQNFYTDAFKFISIYGRPPSWGDIQNMQYLHDRSFAVIPRGPHVKSFDELTSEISIKENFDKYTKLIKYQPDKVDENILRLAKEISTANDLKRITEISYIIDKMWERSEDPKIGLGYVEGLLYLGTLSTAKLRQFAVEGNEDIITYLRHKGIINKLIEELNVKKEQIPEFDTFISEYIDDKGMIPSQGELIHRIETGKLEYTPIHKERPSKIVKIDDYEDSVNYYNYHYARSSQVMNELMIKALELAANYGLPRNYFPDFYNKFLDYKHKMKTPPTYNIMKEQWNYPQIQKIDLKTPTRSYFSYSHFLGEKLSIEDIINRIKSLDLSLGHKSTIDEISSHDPVLYYAIESKGGLGSKGEKWLEDLRRTVEERE